MRKVISILLVILWMLVIFAFSSDEGKKSQSISDDVIETVVVATTNIEKNTKEMDIIKDKSGYIVRKCAHFFVYFILGILVMIALNNYNLRYFIIYASIICIVYAIFDEFHQTFVDGRSGNIKDILLDSSASLMAEYLYMRFFVLRSYEKKNN